MLNWLLIYDRYFTTLFDLYILNAHGTVMCIKFND